MVKTKIIFDINGVLVDNEGNLSIPPLSLSDIFEVTKKRLLGKFKAVKGAARAVEGFQNSYGIQNVALVTESHTYRMNVSLAYAIDPATGRNAQLANLFQEERISTAGQSNKYDYALNLLGWRASETIAIEGSCSGVKNAKGGRLLVIGSVAAPSYKNRETLAEAMISEGADIVISEMSDLLMAAKWLKDGQPETLLPFSGAAYFSKRPTIPDFSSSFRHERIRYNF